jgi:hypothetical protein
MNSATRMVELSANPGLVTTKGLQSRVGEERELVTVDGRAELSLGCGAVGPLPGVLGRYQVSDPGNGPRRLLNVVIWEPIAVVGVVGDAETNL